jgi:alpha-L-fucosidase
MGAWMKVNSDSIYGTNASPFEKLAWGRCTQKQLDGGKTRLYLHVFDWPTDGKLAVSGLKNKATAAYLLSDTAKAKLPVDQKDGAITISLPGKAVDPIDTVVVLDIEGQPQVAK